MASTSTLSVTIRGKISLRMSEEVRSSSSKIQTGEMSESTTVLGGEGRPVLQHGPQLSEER